MTRPIFHKLKRAVAPLPYLRAVLGVFVTVVAAGPALAEAPAGSTTRLELRLDPLADLYFSVRAQAARDAAPEAGLEAAVAAARAVQEKLGAFGGWGPLDSQVISAGDAATLVRRFEELPRTLERAGREIALRDEAIAWARALEAAYADFLERRWPARREALEALVARLERDFLPSHPRALADMMHWLAIDDPAIVVPIVLVTECHPPGASSYYLRDGAPASVLGAIALAERGQLEETILHEATHDLDLASKARGSVFETLRALLAERGVERRDRRFQDIPHLLMFVQAAATVRRIYDPEHLAYGESSGLYARSGEVAEVERRLWAQVLVGALGREEALRRIVDELVPPPEPAKPAAPLPE